MNDSNLARLRAEHGFHFGPWSSAMIRNIGHAFRVLNRIQYRRPWATEARDSDPATCC